MTGMLGVIADDFTGATDVASALVSRGFTTIVVSGPVTPDSDSTGWGLERYDAVVVALKSRTSAREDAVRDSLAAYELLETAGCERFYFKYCSTFDSTPHGNIGPVIDALLERIGSHSTVAVPSVPANGRTVYQGTLFVGRTLLENSSMRNHPLTPMTDSNVLSLLDPQSVNTVGLVDHRIVRAGADAVSSHIDTLTIL